MIKKRVYHRKVSFQLLFKYQFHHWNVTIQHYIRGRLSHLLPIQTIHIIERHLPHCLSKLLCFVDVNGFKFSASKTVCSLFCHHREPYQGPLLTLNDSPIPVMEEVKFLGLVFDRKLTFLPHLWFLKNKSIKALNLILYVLLLSLHGMHIRMHCLWLFSYKSTLCVLDPVQSHDGLRLCLGTFGTSLIPPVYTPKPMSTP